LFGPREQAHGGEHQVMEAEDVGDGTVDLGELAHDGQGFAPVGAEAAEPGGNAQRQQAAVAQRVALGLGCAAAFVAFDGGQGKFGGQLTGGLQRGIRALCGLAVTLFSFLKTQIFCRASKLAPTGIAWIRLWLWPATHRWRSFRQTAR
jgi:hypothetical protein